MGLLDSVAGIMGVFAVNYINNAAMIVLLQQAAIPISMSISKMFLGATYTVSQVRRGRGGMRVGCCERRGVCTLADGACGMWAFLTTTDLAPLQR